MLSLSEQNQKIDWRNNIDTRKPVLKLIDREIVAIAFSDEGTPVSHPDFGDSILFNVIKIGSNEGYRWFVPTRNYALLNDIKQLGRLTGLAVEVMRTGTKKSDTRYTIKKGVVE